MDNPNALPNSAKPRRTATVLLTESAALAAVVRQFPVQKQPMPITNEKRGLQTGFAELDRTVKSPSPVDFKFARLAVVI
jgi:hypothetical protein